MAEFFPGSKQRIPTVVSREAEEATMGQMVTVRGVQRLMFSSGELAKKLNRATVTIRNWERKGTIPRAVYVKPGRDKDPRGRRRLYSEEQVDGMVRIAREEGVLTNLNRPIVNTQFTERVFALFKELGT